MTHYEMVKKGDTKEEGKASHLGVWKSGDLQESSFSRTQELEQNRESEDKGSKV